MKLIYLMLLIFMPPAVSAQQANPFDPHRASPQVITGGQELGEPKKERIGVFCGLEQNLDKLVICIDGSWVSPDRFYRVYGRKIIMASSLGVKLSNGKYFEIGSAFPGWRREFRERMVENE